MSNLNDKSAEQVIEVMLAGIKESRELLLKEDREGFVMGWAENSLCVKYLEDGVHANAVGVCFATVFSGEEVKQLAAAGEGPARVLNGKGEQATLLLKAAVIDKSLAEADESIALLEDQLEKVRAEGSRA